MTYLFWLGAEAEAVSAWVETEAQRALEVVPVVDLTDAQADE